MFKGLNIVIGITGGIAAYKACGIVSYLKNQGANVDVIMTKNATEFITPLTLETLSGNKVITDMFSRPDYMDVKHISLANKADLFLISLENSLYIDCSLVPTTLDVPAITPSGLSVVFFITSTGIPIVGASS